MRGQEATTCTSLGLRAPRVHLSVKRGGSIVLLPVALLLLQSCGLRWERPAMTYYFSHPLLNEQWRPEFRQTTEASREVTAKARPKSTAKASSEAASEAATSDQGTVAGAVDQGLRGNDGPVVRAEVVASASRLLGIRDSFTADSFIRHVLVVNNLVSGSIPEDDVVTWLFGQMPGNGSALPTPGDILFLGEDSPTEAVVVETVDAGGAVTYIGGFMQALKKFVLKF